MLETSEKVPTASLSGLSLAFIGDSVYETVVREYLLRNGSMPVGKLHRLAVKMVCAKAQAHFFDVFEPLLSEEEHEILLRGRNASSTHVPKGACAIEYRKATGVESLFGWLYLNGKNERIHELFEVMTENLPEGVEEA